MFRPTHLLLIFSFLLSFTWLSSSGLWKHTTNSLFNSSPAHPELEKSSFEKLRLKASNVKSFVKLKGYNETICFLIDMSIPSGQNRFFVYNLKKDTLQNSGLVTHGRCNKMWLEGRKYGNTVGCGCSSLGKYRIGNSYTGRFGLAFKLHGLDKTNDKAFERYIVLHAHACVPETAIKDDICQSDGCPTIAPGFLQQLKPIISSSTKPILLWIFE